jgi:methionine-rich copper-binding protein CopC
MTERSEDSHRMRHRRLTAPLAAALLAALPSVTSAHAELTATDPAAGAALDDPPAEVVLTFDGELDPDGSGFTVTDADGSEVGSGGVDLQVAERNVLRGAVSIDDEGIYVVAWTAVAGDGHPERGSFEFRVGEAAQAPDTALAPPAVPLLPAGAVLLAMAALVALRATRSEGTR